MNGSIGCIAHHNQAENGAEGADDDEAFVVDAPNGAMPDLGGAYTALISGLADADIGGDRYRLLAADFAAAAGLDKLSEPLNEAIRRSFPPQMLPLYPDYEPEPINFEPDPTPRIIAANTERAAEQAARQARAVDELVRLTTTSLALATEQREQAARAERFSKTTTWASLAIAIASVGIAAAALIVSL